MRKAQLIVCFILLMALGSLLQAKETEKNIVQIFYKQDDLTLKVLDEVKAILPEFADSIEVHYFDMEDEANLELLEFYYLADIDCPLAVAINGCMSAMINDDLVEFYQYPEGTEHAYRNEGFWTLEDLKAALRNPDLLWTEIWLQMGVDYDGGGE